MKKLKNRLASRRGASLLFAMLVFLLCALAGTAALTAASANSGKYAHMREDQRKYLAVSSAVELMKDQLTNSRFIATLETTEVTTYHGGCKGLLPACGGCVQGNRPQRRFGELLP